jgi:hypothetical protein
MNIIPQNHTSTRWHRQRGETRSGCLITGLVLVGLWIACSVGSMIWNFASRGTHEAENQNAIERQRLVDDESHKREAERLAEQRRVEDLRQQGINYAINIAESKPPTRLTQPYIRGKEVILDSDTETDPDTKKKETKITFKSTEAKSMSEIGTVIIERCNDVAVGDYIERSTGAIQTGYRTDCEVTLIDTSIPAVIYRKTMRGTPPGKHVTIYNYGTITGDPPDIDGFLKTLPRR